MGKRYPLERPVRILAGAFGLIVGGLGVSEFWTAGPVDWYDALTFSALGVLFLYGAIRGESPAWLEPRSGQGEPPEG